MSPFSTRGIRRVRRFCILIFVATLFAWLLGSYLVAYLLTRRPHARYPESSPILAGKRPKSFRLPTADGEDLGAWFFEGSPDAPSVLLLHGNGGDRSQNLEQARAVIELGFSALLISHRAHGDSTGDVNDIGFSARHDVVAAVEWLERNSRGQPIIIWGKSLGAAASLFAVQELGERVRGYILECPYRDLHRAVRNRTNKYLPAPLSSLAFAGLRLVAPLVLPDVDKISPQQAARQVPATVPTLLLAGDADRLALPEEAVLIQQAIGPCAELVVIEGGRHLQLAKADPDTYWGAVVGFLKRFRSTRADGSPSQH